jgi:hypothetical protein
MAYADYKHCAVCDRKVFYDADCCHSYPEFDEPGGRYEQWEREGHAALCLDCLKAHKVVVVTREHVTGKDEG